MATAVSTLLTNVRYKIIDPNSSNFTDAELLIYLNEADRTVRNLITLHAPDLIEIEETGTADSDNYTVTLTNMATTVNNVTLDGKTIPAIKRDHIYDLDDTGKPRGYLMTGFNTLRFYPIPSNDSYTYAVRYIPNYENLDADDDSRYPQMFDDLLTEFVTIRCIARDEGVPQTESSLFGSWREQVSALLDSFAPVESIITGYWPESNYHTDDYGN